MASFKAASSNDGRHEGVEVGGACHASRMVIENARAWVAQLHQCAVGVGAARAPLLCVGCQATASQAPDSDWKCFGRHGWLLIAEKDLELRGPGEVLGTRQTGLAGFRIADLTRDAALLPAIHAAADALLATDPDLADRLAARWVGSSARFAGA